MKQAVNTPTLQPKSAKRFPMRDASTGRMLTVTEKVHLSLPKTFGRTLSMSNNSVEVVLEALHAATSKSRSAGRAYQFIVEVKPNGTPRIVSALAEEDDGTPSPNSDFEIDAAEAADLDRALDEARERGRHLVAEILSGDDMLSADAFAAHLETTRTTINNRRQADQVLALQGATRGYRFPVWQVGADGRPFAALPKLFEALGGESWAVYRFLTQRHDALNGMTGLEALQRGREPAAIAAAEGIAEGTFA